MKGEYFRNWSHIEEPFVFHIQTRSVMETGLVATVFYELVGDEKKLVTGVAFVLGEVVEFLEDGSFVRFPSTCPFGSGDNDYEHGCTTASAWNTWIGVALPGEYLGNLERFLDIIEQEAEFIQPYELGWMVFAFDGGQYGRIEELDILTDGSIESWRSRTLPGAEGTHSSLERQYRWFDLPVESDVLCEELAKWGEAPDLKSLETLILKHVKLVEEADALVKAEEVKEGDTASDEVVPIPIPATKQDLFISKFPQIPDFVGVCVINMNKK